MCATKRPDGYDEDVMSLGDLIPPVVVFVETMDTQADDSVPLMAAEEAALGAVVEKRRREFALGRACAHGALAQLGAPMEPLLPGAGREPLWPDGFIGSITHCVGYSGAAVARQADCASLGIDAEPDAPLPRGILERVAFNEERKWVSAGSSEEHRDRLLFSAKESIYKAWYPLVHRWLGFEDVRVTFDTERNAFRGWVLVDAPLARGVRRDSFGGRYMRHAGLILTAVFVPADRGGR